ncbi:MAG: pilus assembly protein [Candidatus Omnitrophica bacterium]|nr:pilus assembly protein [Candidatus Omnitrophota bacterium]
MRKAQAIVEMALLIPVLLLLVLGIFDASRACLLKANLNEVAREGVRKAALLENIETDDSRVIDYCTQLLEEQGLMPEELTDLTILVELEQSTPIIGDAITVRVSRRFRGISGRIIPFFEPAIPIVGKSVMRYEAGS